MASTSVDHPEVERPIHIDYLSRTREYSFRAEAANGLSRAPINPADSVWDQLSQIPPSQPALTVNAGAGPNFVERVLGLRDLYFCRYPWQKICLWGLGPRTRAGASSDEPEHVIVLRDLHRIIPIIGHVYGKWGIRAARCKGKRASVSRPP